MARHIINTDRAPEAVGPYSQAVAAGGLIFASGQLGLDPATGQFVGYTAAAQIRQAIENIAAVLRAAGSDLSQVVKTTLYLVNMDDFPKVNQVYAEFFPHDPPARATVEVSNLPLSGLVEIEVVAYRP